MRRHKKATGTRAAENAKAVFSATGLEENKADRVRATDDKAAVKAFVEEVLQNYLRIYTLAKPV